MAFTHHQHVLFKYCDPAGFVFFPCYFEMMSDCQERFFDEYLNWPYARLHDTGAVPMVQVETEFSAPSRHGDALVLTLQVQKVGRTSLSHQITAHVGSEPRFRARATIVNVVHGKGPTPWPAPVRALLLATLDAG